MCLIESNLQQIMLCIISNYDHIYVLEQKSAHMGQELCWTEAKCNQKTVMLWSKSNIANLGGT